MYELHLYWLVCAELRVCVNCAEPIADNPPQRHWIASGQRGRSFEVFDDIKRAHYCGPCYAAAGEPQRRRVNEAVKKLRQRLDIRGGKAPSRLKYVGAKGLPPSVHHG